MTSSRSRDRRRHANRPLRRRAPAISGPAFDALSMALDLCNEFSAEPAERLQIENRGRGGRTALSRPGQPGLPGNPRGLPGRRRAPRRCGFAAQPHPARRAWAAARRRSRPGCCSAIGCKVIRSAMDDLLVLATEMEGHPDNVASCLLGGVQVSVDRRRAVLHCARSDQPAAAGGLSSRTSRWIRTKPGGCYPRQVATGRRRVQPRPLGLLVAALAAWPGRAVAGRRRDDRLHQPPRSALFPGDGSAFRGGRWSRRPGRLPVRARFSTILALATSIGRDAGRRGARGLRARNGVGGAARVVRDPHAAAPKLSRVTQIRKRLVAPGTGSGSWSQKYGGSSLADRRAHPRRRAAHRRARRDAGRPVVVVVSAMGDTTDELIELAHQVAPRARRARAGPAAVDRRDGLRHADGDGAARPAAAGACR